MKQTKNKFDKDGELFWLVTGLAALIGGVVNVVAHRKDASNRGMAQVGKEL